MTQKQNGPAFPQLVQEFFCTRLGEQQNASAQTVASYRDTFRLLLRYLETVTGRIPTQLGLSDISANRVLAFLDHCENKRGNSIRTRNCRLAAIRAFLRYAMVQCPKALADIQRVMAIPTKRCAKTIVTHLERDEVQSIIDAPSPDRWSGRRDRALFAFLYNTGARVSEAIGVKIRDLCLEKSAHVRLLGKGRKERSVPLWKSTARILQNWIRENDLADDAYLFQNITGSQLTRSGVAKRLSKAVTGAANRYPNLRQRIISPHVLRHTTAMHLLQAGVEMSVIAIWLGHESPVTTHVYVTANMAMKEDALNSVQPLKSGGGRYRPSNRLLAFLDAL